MSAYEYNTIRNTPVTALGSIPAWKLAAFLISCPLVLRDAVLAARLHR